MNEEPDQSKLEDLRARLGHSLRARFFVRFHAALIIGWTVLVTWLVDVALLSFGMKEMMLRYPLAILVGYVGFLFAVRVWLDYSGVRQYLNHFRANELFEFEQPLIKRDGFDAKPLDFLVLDAEGCVVVLGVVLVATVVGMFMGVLAAPILIDVVLEVILAAGMIKGLRKAESSGWVTGAWQSTKWSLFIVLFVAIVFAGWAKISHPGAATMSQTLSGQKAR